MVSTQQYYAPALVLVILSIQQSLAREWLVAGDALQHSYQRQTQTSILYWWSGISKRIHTDTERQTRINNKCIKVVVSTQGLEAILLDAFFRPVEAMSSRRNVSGSSERTHRSLDFGPFNPTYPHYGRAKQDSCQTTTHSLKLHFYIELHRRE